MKLKLVSLFACMTYLSLTGQAQDQTTLNIGDEAPRLTVGRWVKGEPVTEFRKNHVYVMDFWATWCVPCKENMPHMTELARQYRGKATFIAMSVSEPARPGRDIFTMVDAVVRKMGNKMDVNVAIDTEDGAVNQAWMKAAGLGSLPSIIVVDQEGKVAWMGQPRGLDSTLAAIVAGTFDRDAFARQRASRPNTRQRSDESLMAAFAPIQKALSAKDYPLAISEYEKHVSTNPRLTENLGSHYYRALVHVDPDKAYRQAMAVKGTAKEYDLAGVFCEEEGLQKRFYDYAINYFIRRSENDFFAMGKVAKAYFNAGDIAKAVEVQRQFVKDIKLPTTPSTLGYIKREEDVLKKYEAAVLIKNEI